MFSKIFSGISSALAPFLAKLLSVFGISLVGALGFEAVVRPALTKLQQQALSQLNAIPPELRQFVFLTGINDAISIIFGAFFAALAIKGAKAVAAHKASKYKEPWNGF